MDPRQLPLPGRGAGHEDILLPCAPRLPNAARAIHIRPRLPHPIGIIVEQPERGIAFVAEQPAHLLRFVAMIDAEPPPRFLLADDADAVLLDHHPLVVVRAEAVLPLPPPHPPPVAKRSIRPPLFAP